jgi:hypothetical protein
MQIKVPDLGQNPMQSGLILDWAGNEGIAVLQGGQRQALEPSTPVAVQLAPDANFIMFKSCSCHKWNLLAIEWIVSAQREYFEEY